MSPTRFAVLTLILVAAPAAAQDDPKAVIQKAVQAKGGADRIDRYPAAVIESKGMLFQGGHAVPFTARTVYELPDRGRIALEQEGLGGKTQAVQIFDGSKARVAVNGQPPKELPEIQTRDFRESHWSEQPLEGTDAEYVYQLKQPGSGFAAALCEVRYEIDGHPLYLCTNIRVVSSAAAARQLHICHSKRCR